ncbi:MAG: hypothetical protein K6G32_12230, partial [Prevotella sp.]|nr:hypothetical protein [Prevotella sp.]
FNSFVLQMMAMGSRGTDKRLGEWLSTETSFWVTIWQPNSFTNPPNFELPSFSYFHILPRFAFISERIALIFQNQLFYTSFFRNFAFELSDNIN